MTIVSVYALFANPEEAHRIARAVVEERLAACANILAPCHSIYRWQGAIEEATETPALFKTTRDQADSLIARIAALHSYENPCITVWPIDKLPDSYAEWVKGSVG